MYTKLGSYYDKLNFGNQVVVYKSDKNYFVVIKDREEVVFYFVDRDMKKIYPTNTYMKQIGFTFHHQEQIEDFNPDLSICGYSDCPENVRKIIKKMIKH